MTVGMLLYQKLKNSHVKPPAPEMSERGKYRISTLTGDRPIGDLEAGYQLLLTARDVRMLELFRPIPCQKVPWEID